MHLSLTSTQASRRFRTSGRLAVAALPASVDTHAVSSVSGKNWSYSYDPNGNMTTRSENGTAYTQEFNAENKVERVVTLEDADFSDQFDTKDTNAWAYNSYQTVPFNLSGHGNVVKNVGTGNDYTANFRRKGYNLTSGESVRFEFRVTESNSYATFAVETSGSWDVDYNRWGLRARNDKITIHYRTGGVTTQSVTLIDDLETDTWYVATLVMDDGNGFYLRIHKKDDPSIQGSYHFDGMPVGKSWRFRHWIKYGTSYVDNYSEQSASQTAFVYDGDGNRVKRQEGGVTTYYPSAGSGQAVGGYYEKQGSTVTKYYYFGGKRVAMRKGSTLTYLHGDHLGSTSLATDGTSGAKLSRVLYFPYGETRHEEGTLPTDFKYTGQREEGFGLYDYVARFYDPYLNRFISADTVVPSTSNPQDWNRYTYVGNNPVLYRDPSGHRRDPGGDDLPPAPEPPWWQAAVDFADGAVTQFVDDMLLGLPETIVTDLHYSGVAVTPSDHIVGNRAFDDGRLFGRIASTVFSLGETVGGVVEIVSSVTVLPAVEAPLVVGSGPGAPATAAVFIAVDATIFAEGIAMTGHGVAVLGHNSSSPLYFEGRGGGDAGRSLKGKAGIEAARELGYTRRIPPQRAPFNSHGQQVFYNPKTKTYVTVDIDSHTGGVWKMFDRQGNRLGTYDADLNWIGD